MPFTLLQDRCSLWGDCFVVRLARSNLVARPMASRSSGANNFSKARRDEIKRVSFPLFFATGVALGERGQEMWMSKEYRKTIERKYRSESDTENLVYR